MSNKRLIAFIPHRASLILFFAALLLWSLAYQAPFSLRLAVGGDGATTRREDDAPYLVHMNGSEPASATVAEWWTLPPGYAYRWTRSASALAVPGVGGGPWALSLLASSGRPDGLPAASVWQIGRHTLALSVTATPRRYHLLVPADAAGDLRVALQTSPYNSLADPRDLGFVLREVRLTAAGGGPRAPALAQLGWLALTVSLVYGLSRWLALGRTPALALAGGGVLAAALVLATARTALTLFTPALAGLALACAIIGVGLRIGYRALRRANTQYAIRNTITISQLSALVLLAFTIRMAGVLHPHAIFSDARFNANNLYKVELGMLYFTAGLPDESGGGQAPYPPALYLLLVPAALFAPATSDGRMLLVQSGTALLDSLVVGLIGLLLLRAGAGRRAALLGAACYLVPPPLMASFSVGEYANVGGQALALPAIAVLAWGGLPHSRRAILVLAVLIAAGLLAHFGVAITLTLYLAALWLVDAGRWLACRDEHSRARLGRLAGAGLLAGLLVALIYYSAPQFAAIFAERVARGGSGASGATGAALPRIIAGLTVDLFLPGSRLAPLLVGLGLCGGALLWSHTGEGGAALARALTGWWLAILLAQGLLLIASQGLRWQHFLYPALCLGAGPALATCWRRGRAGRVVVTAAVAFLVSYGLMQWVLQIRDYLH